MRPSPGPAVAARDPHPWFVGIGLLGILWLGYSVVGYLASQLLPREPFGGNWEELVYTTPPSSLISFWQRWDALWYQHIAESGYAAGDGSSAFFPLYPVLARVTSSMFLGNTLLGELVVSGVAFTAAAVLLMRLVRLEADGQVARAWNLPYGPASPERARLPLLTVLLIVFFPVGFFLVAPYTESLFLALAVATLLLARTGHPWLAGLVGLLASLTRPQGIFLALPIAYEVLRERRSWEWLRGRGGRPPGVDVLAAVLPLGGLVLFTAYQWTVLGQQRTGLDIQALWGYQVVMPWDAIAASWAFLTEGVRDLNSKAVEAFNLLCLVGAAALAVVGARRLPGAYTLYALPSIGLLLFREMYFSPLMSVGRYVVVVVPLFMVVAAWLAGRPRVAVATLIASGIAEVLLFQYWTRWGFVG